MCLENSQNLTKQDLKKQINYNRKRSNRVSALKRKNFDLTKQVELIKKQEKDDKKLIYLDKLDKNLSLCASHSLYREHLENNAIEYIGSHTCDHKLCFVCNNLRQKRLRRKYLQFFQENKELYLLKQVRYNTTRAYTKSSYNKINQSDKAESFELVDAVEYDLMHLTLTLPHYKGTGFRGYPYYYDQLIKIFNILRKKKQWNELVYGGEYGIETTKGKNGLNIHVHALLMVKRSDQNRNLLHKYLLKQWNKMSVNAYSPREKLSPAVKKSILKSNNLLELKDVNKLNPKGSTIITLETIYALDDNGNKVRGNTFGSEAMLKAVMETISYHFEPQCFDKKNGEYDLDLMVEIMPELHGKPLYRKFGCLHGEASLNLKQSVSEQLEDDLKESGHDIIVNPETLEVAEREQYDFVILNPAQVYHIPEEEFRIVATKNATRYYLNDADNTLQALMYMTHLFVNQVRRKRT